MRALGLDIGDKRIGVAVSDPMGAVATPLTVLDARSAQKDPRELRRLIDDYEVGLIVVGLPLSMDGTEGPQARHVRAIVTRLDLPDGLAVEFVDERLSSAEANRRMADAGLSERDRRGSVDKVAAAVFLQTYLDTAGGER